MGGVDFSYQSPSFSPFIILILIILGLIFITIGFLFLKIDRKLGGVRIENKFSRKINGLLSFEKLKIKSFNKNVGLNFTLIAIFLLVFSINLRLKMSSHDFYAYKNTFTTISIVRDMAEFEKDNNLGEKAQTYLDKLNLLDKYREDVDSENFYKIISKASLFSKSLGDDFNPALADEHFRQTASHIGIRGKVSINIKGKTDSCHKIVSNLHLVWHDGGIIACVYDLNERVGNTNFFKDSPNE